MTASGRQTYAPGTGQVLLPAASSVMPPTEQARNLYRLSDPVLSELSLDELLDEESQQLVARAAKGIEEEVERGVRIPIGRGFAGRIASERAAIFIADVDHADILNPILREKGISSLLGVPLIVEGELLGVLHVGSLQTRTFGQEELAILQFAAARVAPAIERARLFLALEHEHRVAVLLQRSLLPKLLPDVPGVRVAGRYLPARDEVGGDWYDVIELPRGLLGIAIGDVVGHGMKAAALMGQLRTSLHSYAMEGHGPGHTLELVDRFAQGMAEPAMATAAYALFDPDKGTLRFASAGHLPPLIVAADGARTVELPPATPLGAFPYSSFPEYELSLGSHETLVLYTDGLVERRDTPLSDSIESLSALVGDARSPEDVCLLAFDRLLATEKLRDDAAIVALQNMATPVELHLRLPANPKALSAMRHALRRWLRERGLGDAALRDVTIAVSEACANAIEHAYSPAPATFELDASADAEELTVTVRDSGQWRAARGRDRGRGLRIIEAAMDQVEMNSTEAGTTVVMRKRFESQ